MSRNAVITVVIPSRDRRDLLVRTMASVLRQQGTDVQVIVVDDGGRDGTTQWLQRLEEPRVTVIRHEEPRGVSAARNTGVAAAATRYVAFVDDDDLWSPTKLVSQLDALRRSGSARWSYTGAVHIDEQYRALSWHPARPQPDLVASLLAVNVVPGGGSSVLVERDLAVQVGGFDESLSNLADWDFNIALALQAGAARVPDLHVGYLVRAGSMAHGLERSRREYDYLRIKYRRAADARGVAPDDLEWRKYLAELAYRANRRRTGVALHLREFAEGHRARALSDIAVGLGPRRLRDIRLRRDRRLFSDHQVRAAGDWLAPYHQDFPLGEGGAAGSRPTTVVPG